MRAFLLAFVLILAGCASTYGKPITQSQLDMLVVGKTTVRESVEIFGKPVTDTINSDGTRVLGWGYAKSTFGSPMESQGISIVFDRHGKMASFSRSSYGGL